MLTETPVKSGEERTNWLRSMEGMHGLKGQHRVVMVSDFFYPNFGGVENHIYQLSQCLINLGLKVVVVTHAYGNCTGIRYLTNGLKVYYLPRLPFYQQATFPTLLGWARLLRVICVREGATLLHGHQAFSTMALEACINARSLGLKVVFTDHSLFGFADPGSILLNKVLKAVLSDVHAVICVSHTSKENTVLRACLPPARVSVIPNAVDASQFQPDPRVTWPSDPARDEVVLVVLCRLVYRKGVDLLSLVLPEVCARHDNVRVLVGGDGPKRALLEKVISDHGLGERIRLEGAVPHERARDFMVRGHVFVNASLTEAFCMALVEAAAAGLVVVSTAVGGVPEVLPPDMIVLAEPSAEGLLTAIEAALLRVPHQRPAEQHERVRQMYDWNDVARRTVKVYDAVAASTRDDGLPARLQRYAAAGRWVGALFGAVAVLSHLLMVLMDWWQPRHTIDVAPDWPRQGGGSDGRCDRAEGQANDGSAGGRGDSRGGGERSSEHGEPRVVSGSGSVGRRGGRGGGREETGELRERRGRGMAHEDVGAGPDGEAAAGMAATAAAATAAAARLAGSCKGPAAATTGYPVGGGGGGTGAAGGWAVAEVFADSRACGGDGAGVGADGGGCGGTTVGGTPAVGTSELFEGAAAATGGAPSASAAAEETGPQGEGQGEGQGDAGGAPARLRRRRGKGRRGGGGGGGEG
ncbi:hypothetical protein PLESTB_001099500 [Pleodorina starrii]|uniref:phosphatidylinositol N-acetylglucosaminyltransferase n=1 Tax=Pleodorina starrii TaxID=330485 RepID=A0A9W6BQV2_9CHLO|nr:hypothetical protein PLESTB_001099500 [Pleodorina starrii]